MISKVLSDSFITIKNNSKNIFIMSLPVIVIGVLFNLILNGASKSVSKSLNQLDVNQINLDSVFSVLSPYTGLGIGLLLLTLLLSYLKLSVSMGYLKSDQENDFQFKNGFALFMQKNTWWKIIVISIIYSIGLGIFSFLCGLLIFIAAVLFKSIILTLLLGLAAFVLYIYVTVTFSLNYLNYYDDVNKENKTGFFLSFKNTWTLMSGQRGRYFGLLILIGLFYMGVTWVLSFIFGGLSFLFSLIPVFESFWYFVSSVLISVISLTIAIYTNMVSVKFFEEIKK